MIFRILHKSAQMFMLMRQFSAHSDSNSPNKQLWDCFLKHFGNPVIRKAASCGCSPWTPSLKSMHVILVKWRRRTAVWCVYSLHRLKSNHNQMQNTSNHLTALVPDYGVMQSPALSAESSVEFLVVIRVILVSQYELSPLCSTPPLPSLAGRSPPPPLIRGSSKRCSTPLSGIPLSVILFSLTLVWTKM